MIRSWIGWWLPCVSKQLSEQQEECLPAHGSSQVHVAASLIVISILMDPPQQAAAAYPGNARSDAYINKKKHLNIPLGSNKTNKQNKKNQAGDRNLD